MVLADIIGDFFMFVGLMGGMVVAVIMLGAKALKGNPAASDAVKKGAAKLVVKGIGKMLK